MNNYQPLRVTFGRELSLRRITAIAVLFASLMGMATAGSESTAQNWARKRVSYHFASVSVEPDYVPPEGSPSKAVYDAFALIARKRKSEAAALLTDDTKPHAEQFIKAVGDKVSLWKIEFLQEGILDEQGWAYVAFGGDRPLQAESNKGVFAPFTSVIFLKNVENRWLITHKTLDPIERKNVIDRFTVLRQGVSKAQVEADIENSRRKWFEMTAKPLGVDPIDWDADAAYAKQKAIEAYLNKRQQAGTLATTFKQMVEMYGGEYISPPVTFSVTEEPDNPNFNNLLDAFQTAIYLRLLRHNAYPRKWEWKVRSIINAQVAGGVPKNITDFSYIANISLGKLTRVQVLCRVPLKYKGNEYQVIHFRLVYSDDDKTMLINDYRPKNKSIAFGYAYFKKEGNRWLPNKDLDGYPGFARVYGSFKSIDESLADLTPNQAKSRNISTVKGYFKDSPMPEPMRRLYETENCISIEKARESGMWKDL